MTLLLEIEYLTGIVFAGEGPDTAIPDWPPQPDRVFSALVASWAARGKQDEEAHALRWLESQPAPFIAASHTEPRTVPAVYVAPNDFATSKSKTLPMADSRQFHKAIGVIPRFRQRKERAFPASRPHDPVVRHYWKSVNPSEKTFAALARLAADTAYVGHSASLTRCRFLMRDEFMPLEVRPPARRIYEGRFEELCNEYQRFVNSRGKIGRPLTGAWEAAFPSARKDIPHSYFSAEWLVLEHTGGVMPDIRATALVSKEIREALLSGYRKCGMRNNIPCEVSGHTQDGSPIQAPHLAIVPLAFAGFPVADGHVLGFALVPPQDSELFRDPTFLAAIRKVSPPEGKQRTLRWCKATQSMSLRRFRLSLSPTLDPSRNSLAPNSYTREARTFATVTPIVLDRHLKGDGAERRTEIVELIKRACEHIGLPDPHVVIPHKYSPIEGIPAAYGPGSAPKWLDWRLPPSSLGRQITHAVIQFSSLVAGPIILGAGRFAGLGLCRPIADSEDWQ